MPEIGEIVSSKTLDLINSKNRRIWAACERCGKERWVRFIKGTPEFKFCNSCSKKGREYSEEHKRKSSLSFRGNKNPNWQGGKYNCHGYNCIPIYPEDPFYNMSNGKGSILEHRLIMAQHLGRRLLKIEHVHHKNGVRNDNRIENLELISPKNHAIYKSMCSHCELRTEIRLLKWQVKELTQQLQEKMRI